MSTDGLPAERHQIRYERTRHDSEWSDGYRTGRHDRWLVAGIGGGLLGYAEGTPVSEPLAMRAVAVC